IRCGGRYLVCQRKEDAAFPLKWEFAGGKVEPGEGAFPALQRELREELGIEVDWAKKLFEHSHIYGNQMKVDLKFYLVDRFAGEVTNKVFKEIRWVDLEGLKKLDFLEANQPLLRRLDEEI
ncbi:MAG: NUDIX domain-containing protein, partial [Deltaproteobacteria bacterium]|nr:NUDIX domain-containing protein [Deltaproteobacteria bacterium]